MICGSLTRVSMGVFMSCDCIFVASGECLKLVLLPGD